MTPLAGWQNFYVIVGSSAGALIGLQFVVMALLADMPRTAASAQAGHAFATPNIVHFGMALFLSAELNAPWRSLTAAAIVWGVSGMAGVLYCVIVTRRMRTQTAYQPELEDWLFHSILPIVAYLMLAASAFGAGSYARQALFAVAAAALLLLFIGIHNAWDAATYHVLVQRHKP